MKINYRNILLLLTLISGLCSCLSKETPVPLQPKGDETTATVELGADYPLQVYYSLKNNTVVGKNNYGIWDLGFETAADGYHIILNGAKFNMVSYRTNKKDFSAVSIADTAGLEAKIDMPSGSLDSTAIGDWRDGNVYIIFRGLDELTKNQGVRKIQIISVDANKYIVRFAEINGANEKTLEIVKDGKYNFTFLSFNEGGNSLLVEPPKEEWDIVFSKYTHYYYDAAKTKYSVLGCLHNRYNTSAGRDTATKSFSEIDLQQAASVTLLPNINVLGYDWKSTDADFRFIVHPEIQYIIKDQGGVYYKLRFVAFYNNMGIKGNPKWEYQRL